MKSEKQLSNLINFIRSYSICTGLYVLAGQFHLELPLLVKKKECCSIVEEDSR